MIKRFHELFERYERRASVLALITALLIDSFTLHRIDLYLTNVLLTVYLLIASFSITVLNLHEAGRAKWISEGVHLALLVSIQFALGGLFGRFLVYYSRSGAFFASWPFLLILLVLLVGNEFARKYYTRLVLQVSLLFLAVFSFLIFFIPIVIGKMGAMIFLLAGFVSLLVIALFVSVLNFFIPERINSARAKLIASLGTIFMVVNFLYFANIIPPIPLSLSSVGVYYSITRTPNGGYQGLAQKKTFRDLFNYYQDIYLVAGEPLYAYSAVFAPTDFGASVVHAWQRYDEKGGEWVDAGMIPFGIVGGRDGGYRGHSVKNNVTPGFWRVNIETGDGQVIGRISFEVHNVNVLPLLVKENL